MFEPAINLLVLLGTLSMAAEQLANVVKLEHPDSGSHCERHQPPQKR